MAQDKENRSKLRAEEVREVNQHGHASVPSNPSQGENVETPIANEKDTGGSGNDNLVSPGFSRQHDAVAAQQSQYLVSPGARSSNVSHPSPVTVNSPNTGTQHLFNLPHGNRHPLPDSFSDHNVQSYIAGAPHRHDHGEQNQQQQNHQQQNYQEQNYQEQNYQQQNHQQQHYQQQHYQQQNYQQQNQHPIANPLDGHAFHPSVAGVSHHRNHSQVSLPNPYGSNTVPDVVGAPYQQQSGESAAHQPANPSQRANDGNLPIALGFSPLNQQAANNFQGVAVQHYAYAEELQYMGSAQSQPAPQYDPNYLQGIPEQQYQVPQEPQPMGIVQGNGAAHPNYIQGVSAEQHQLSQQPPPMGTVQDIPAVHQNNFPSAYPNNVSAAQGHSTGFHVSPPHHQLSPQPQPVMNMAQGILAAYYNNVAAAQPTGSHGVPLQWHQPPQQPQPMPMMQGNPAAHANNFQVVYLNQLPAAHPPASQVIPAQQHQPLPQPQPIDMVEPIPAYDPLDLGIPQDQPHPIIPGPPHPQANHPAVLALEDIDTDQDINEIIDAAASVLHADHRQCQHKWVDEDDVEHQCTGHA